AKRTAAEKAAPITAPAIPNRTPQATPQKIETPIRSGSDSTAGLDVKRPGEATMAPPAGAHAAAQINSLRTTARSCRAPFSDIDRLLNVSAVALLYDTK